ncbi:hypothetical protein FRC15_009811 [Serendipita sp. 397]|nr:hypothetical protein FRC15_009811 [Serendipita sp. 397]
MPPKRRAASDVEGLPNSAPKRARFADPHDDDRASSNAAKVKRKEAMGTNENFDSAGFADEVDATLDMAGKQKRKGAVKVDGYESDSTDDGEGVVLSRRKAEQEEDNDDMFAMGDGDDDEEKKDDGKKKQTRYLQLGEIEGQEFGADDEEKEFDEDELGVDEDSVSSSEPEDEDDAERRKKAGMGYELTKFNMKEEMEEGKFAEDGMYVRSYDAHATHDRWLEDVAERDIKKARRAKRKAEKREQERVKEENKSIDEITADGTSATGKAGMEKKLLEYLLPSETVLEALARLGREKKKKEAKLKKKAKAEDTSF